MLELYTPRIPTLLQSVCTSFLLSTRPRVKWAKMVGYGQCCWSTPPPSGRGVESPIHCAMALESLYLLQSFLTFNLLPKTLLKTLLVRSQSNGVTGLSKLQISVDPQFSYKQ